ncbi:MAG: hypothetical protein ACKOYQ_00390, partial [Actinomycetota bacterium]
PPVDNRLQGTSSWINLVTKRDRRTPAGWQGVARVQHSAVPGASMVEIDEPTTLPEGFHS